MFHENRLNIIKLINNDKYLQQKILELPCFVNYIKEVR